MIDAQRDTETAMPTKAKVREGARKLMRDCLARAGQMECEEVVNRQAEKIVRSFWPKVKRAWQENAHAR